MDAKSIKIGMHVRLTSGGPVMVVSAAVSADGVRCKWFTPGTELFEATFDEACLELVIE